MPADPSARSGGRDKARGRDNFPYPYPLGFCTNNSFAKGTSSRCARQARSGDAESQLQVCGLGSHAKTTHQLQEAGKGIKALLTSSHDSLLFFLVVTLAITAIGGLGLHPNWKVPIGGGESSETARPQEELKTAILGSLGHLAGDGVLLFFGYDLGSASFW